MVLLRFPVDDNLTMKSVVEYFQEMYDFTIQHTHLPCLQVGNQKKANYLPMEVVPLPLIHLFIWFAVLKTFMPNLHAFVNARHAKLLRGNAIQSD